MEITFELLPLSNYYTAPAHPHVTDAAVYTALFFQRNAEGEITKKAEEIKQTFQSLVFCFDLNFHSQFFDS